MGSDLDTGQGTIILGLHIVLAVLDVTLDRWIFFLHFSFLRFTIIE